MSLRGGKKRFPQQHVNERSRENEMEQTERGSEDERSFILWDEQSQGPVAPAGTMQDLPEVVEDFLRNALRRAGLRKTLGRFEAEWYDSTHKLPPRAVPLDTPIITALTQRQHFQQQLLEARRQTDMWRQELLVLRGDLVTAQRERDLHQMKYRRITDENERLRGDLRRLKEHLKSYPPALTHLDGKYQAALKNKIVSGLNKDR